MIFAVILAAGSLTTILIDIVLIASRRIVQLPTLPVSATLTIHKACRSSRRIIFAIVLAASSVTAILIDIVLVMSCRIEQLPTIPLSATLTIHEAR